MENLNKEQLKAYNIITKTNENVFITGSGGTGKSYILKYVFQNFNKNKVKYAITAPTGVSSININGQTLTSLFGISPKNDTFNSIFDDNTGKIKKNIIKPYVSKIINNLDVLIIDEISMITKDLFNIINIICKNIRKIYNKPFGGIKIIMFGDFLQLGPVPSLNTKTCDINNEITIYRNKHNKNNYIFTTILWNLLNLNIINLKINMRQKNYKLFNLLNCIRYGNIKSDEINILYKLNILEKDIYKKKYKNWIILFGSNKNKNIYNNVMLNKINNETKTYKSKLITTYDLNKIKNSDLYNTIPKKLEIKKNARIMITKNININSYNIINGDLGYVVDFDDDDYPIINLDRLKNINLTIKTQKWEIFDQNSNPVIVIEQIPLTLGWAITVHKSQGLTFNNLIIYFHDINFFGQSYVALSRITSLKNLRCIGFDINKIKANKKCIDFYNNLK